MTEIILWGLGLIFLADAITKAHYKYDLFNKLRFRIGLRYTVEHTKESCWKYWKFHNIELCRVKVTTCNHLPVIIRQRLVF